MLGVGVRRAQLDLAEHRAQHPLHLQFGIAGGETAPRAAAEGDPGVGPRRLLEEALGQEMARVRIDLRVAMDQVDAGGDGGPCGQLTAAQFAAELLYFSDCILKNRMPEPSGEEGLQDVRIVEALYRSSRTGKPVTLPPFRKSSRPTGRQRITRPGVRKPALIKVQSASED